MNGEQLYTVHVCFSQVFEVMLCGVFFVGLGKVEGFMSAFIQKSGLITKTLLRLIMRKIQDFFVFAD